MYISREHCPGSLREMALAEACPNPLVMCAWIIADSEVVKPRSYNCCKFASALITRLGADFGFLAYHRPLVNCYLINRHRRGVLSGSLRVRGAAGQCAPWLNLVHSSLSQLRNCLALYVPAKLQS